MAPLKKLLLLALCWLAGLAQAQPLRIDQLPETPLGPHLLYLQERNGPLGLEQARAALQRGEFRRDDRSVASFGLAARPVWIYLWLDNPLERPQALRLALGMSWIDSLDVHHLAAGRMLAQAHSGDEAGPRAGAAALLPGLGYGFPLNLPPGQSELFIRVASQDPMVLPLRLLDEAQARAGPAPRLQAAALPPLLVCGALLALALHQLLLFAGLRQTSQPLYALHLLAFAALELALSGLGYAFVWPEEAAVQRYAIPLATGLFGLSGLLLGAQLLRLGQLAPLRQRQLLWGLPLALLPLPACIALDWHVAALAWALTLLLLAGLAMLQLGLWALERQQPAAALFLAASLGGPAGAALTVMAIWGWLPLNGWTAQGLELGVLAQALLLALALERDSRARLRQRWAAGRQRRLDPLSGLPTRLAFFDEGLRLWSAARRRARPLCALLLEIESEAEAETARPRLAELLRQQARDGDLAADWGEARFLLLLPETGAAEAQALARHLCAAAAAQGIRLRQGLASSGAEPSLEQLIAAADGELYRAARA
ncbi:7TM diverse intracellular signaling domain-containing protein [Roseateles violae]|uniref:7TM diverse intracellular signaling domain-containing protein n=1 Tax=Roseateles violae TaxID=3058042 RepID=A0ABT8DUC5_9BURK|nr:7TM diverse intracellular signaling domain-containing protein [Pelomonas sp. PFR6]MDN3921787.1 7TM diverse intracellular signaling domain-containing protein [Pelomonas sp. PFR6]